MPDNQLKKAVKKYRASYSKLHDIVSDIVEDGDLEGILEPNQYRKLVDQLAGPCNRTDASMKKALKEDR